MNQSRVQYQRRVDDYGKTKFLGECSHSNVLNLRTSIIGHELSTSHSLLEWFLRQNVSIYGFKNAIFSGFPTCVVATFLHNIITSNLFVSGTYHFSSEPIDKFTLLTLFSDIYAKDISIIPKDLPIIDRSLDSSLLRSIIPYTTDSWPDMIKLMRQSSLDTSTNE